MPPQRGDEFKAETDVEKMLADTSSKYHLEYLDGVHVHMHQGAIAMHALGIPSEKILEFCNECLKAGYYEEKGESQVDLTPDNFMEWCGKDDKDGFATLRKFFFTREEPWQDVVKTYFPKIMSGMGYTLLHGLLQVGAGIEGFGKPNVGMILEGMAWSGNGYFDYTPETKPNYCFEDTKPAHGRVIAPLDFLAKALADAKRTDASEEMQKVQNTLPKNPKKMALLSYATHPDKAFHKLLDYGTLLFDRDLEATMEAVSTVVAACYYVDGPEFFVLHGITGWWALRKILPYLPDDDARFEAIAHLIRSVVTVYVYTFLPAIDNTVKLLQEMADPEAAAKNPLFAKSDTEPADANWQAIVDHTCLTFTSFPDVDAHHPKVIHALWEDWKKYGYKPIFLKAAQQTLTKELFRNHDLHEAGRDHVTSRWDDREEDIEQKEK